MKPQEIACGQLLFDIRQRRPHGELAMGVFDDAPRTFGLDGVQLVGCRTWRSPPMSRKLIFPVPDPWASKCS